MMESIIWAECGCEVRIRENHIRGTNGKGDDLPSYRMPAICEKHSSHGFAATNERLLIVDHCIRTAANLDQLRGVR